MSGNPSSPTLRGSGEGNWETQKPKSQRSRSSLLSRYSQRSKRTPEASEESTPLLLHDDRRNYGDANSRPESPVASSSRSLQSDGWSGRKSSRRWPSIVALIILTLVLLAILGFGFAAPEVMEEYAKEAVIFKPTDLSIDSFTSSGVRARIQGDFTMDASRVHKKAVRDLGRAGTWIAKAVESKRTTVEVHLPEYDDVLLGSAVLPPIVVDIRNGHTTHLDFITELNSGDVDGIRRIGMDWLDGRLGQLRVQGTADICLKSGIFRIGPQTISKSIVFKGDEIPVFPEYDITNLKFDEGHRDAEEGMLANVSLVLSNDYPVSFEIPSLRFDILVPGCLTSDPYIAFADAVNSKAQVRPKKNVDINVSGFVRKLPETLITACPNTERSPIDRLLHSYIQGDGTTIYVRGSKKPLAETPNWITALIEDIVVPLPFPGHTFSDLIRNFSLTNVHFGLPDPFAAPTSPKSSPRLSAVVEALIGLPEEIQFPIDVGRVRANSDIFYHKKKLGSLDLSEWQRANSTRAELKGDDRDYLLVRSTVKDAPLDVTDDNVLADIVQALIFGGKPIELGVKANVDVETTTVLGQFVIRDVPAEGKFFVKPISGNDMASFSPKVGDLEILGTTKSSITFEAKVNITNPTEYSATVPFVNVNMLVNDTVLGHATAENVSVVPGPNYDIPVLAVWNPSEKGGRTGFHVGEELLSQYVSGYNTSLTFRTHAGTIPSQPHLGRALSKFSVSIPTPNLPTPKNPNHPDDGNDGDDEDPDSRAPRFIDDATMHILTSTATLTLLSPLRHTTMHIETINATAFYNGDPVGQILYDVPFAVPPGPSTTPRLPVDWSLGSVGFDAVKKALGGRLKVEAYAEAGLRVGEYIVDVWYEGHGIGAHVRV